MQTEYTAHPHALNQSSPTGPIHTVHEHVCATFTHTQLSNKARTQWYSVLEAVTIIVVTGVQIYTITHFFKTGRIKISV